MAYPLFYPLEVLSTNRILGTSLISSEPAQFQLLPQLKGLYNSGLSNLFRGFVPQIMASTLRNIPAIFVISNGVLNPEAVYSQSLLLAAFGTIVANPLEILAVRYQSVDFKRGAMLRDFGALWSASTTRLFSLGLYHAMARNLTIAAVVSSSPPNNQVSPFISATIAAALSQPFEYLRVRQMYGEEIGENTFKAAMEVIQTKGVTELFKGFGARGLLYLIYAEGIAYALANRETLKK